MHWARIDTTAARWICVFALALVNASSAQPPEPVAPYPSSVRPTTPVTDPGMDRQLREVRAMLDAGEFDRALERAQAILDRRDDPSIESTDHQWTPARAEVEQLLRAAGQEVLERYQERYRDESVFLFAKGEQTADPAIWGELARRFFLTPVGRSAVDRLGTMYLDQGRMILADFYFAKLVATAPNNDPSIAMIRAKRAVAQKFLGETSAEEESSIVIGGAEVSFHEWLDRFDTDLSEPARDTKPESADAVGELPMLAADWHQPITEDEALDATLHDVAEASIQRRSPLSYEWRPLFLPNEWILRDIEGLWRIDPTSGTRVAEIHCQSSVLKTARSPSTRALVSPPGAGGLETTFIKNGVYGHITADDERIYFIDALSLNPNSYLPGFMRQRGEPGDEERNQNTIVAVDRTTYEPLWQRNVLADFAEDADYPVFFLGPPTPVGDDLFVLGESRSELVLVCLAPATGEVRWQMVLASASRSIDADLFRRSQPAHIASVDGLLLVSTNLFFVVAIDPRTRCRLWECSLASPGNVPAEYRGGAQAVPPPKSAPLTDGLFVVGSTVLVSEPLGRLIHAIDLHTGAIRWETARDDDWYYAGVSDDLLVAVGTNRIRGIRTTDGTTAWSTPIPTPSGRGAVVDAWLMQPTSDGRVLALSMASGALAGEVETRDRAPIGTLLATKDGGYLGVSADGIDRYRPIRDARERSQKLLAANHSDGDGLLLAAETEITLGEIPKAITLLKQIVRSESESSVLPRARSLLFDIATREATADPALAGTLIDELGPLAKTDAERGVYLRLKADTLAGQGDIRSAIERLADHAELALKDLIPGEEIDLERAPAAWELAFLHRWANGTTRADIDLLRGRFEDPAVAWRLIRSMPHATNDRAEIVDRLIAQGDWGQAELRLREQDLSEQPDEKSRAFEQLVDLMITHEEIDDASAYLDGWSERDPASVDPAAIHQRREQLAALPQTVRSSPWPMKNVQVVSERNYRLDPNKRVVFPADPSSTFFSPWTLIFDNQRHELAFHSRQSGELDWKVDDLPPSLAYQQSLTFHDLGGLLFFAQAESVYAVSKRDRQMRWRRAFDDWREPETQATGSDGRLRPSERSRSSLSTGPIAWPKLISATPHAVVVRIGRQLVAVDPWSGATLWRQLELRQGDTAVADIHAVAIYSESGNFNLRRPADGTMLAEGTTGLASNDIHGFYGIRPLIIEPPSIVGGQRTVRLFDPRTGTDSWLRTVPATLASHIVADRHVVLFNAAHEYWVIDLETGNVLIREDGSDRKGNQANGTFTLVWAEDDSRLYLCANQSIPGENSWPVAPSQNLRLALVHGWIRAYDKTTGERIWHRDLTNRSVVTEPGRELPILVTVGNRMEELDSGGKRLATSVELIDKSDGSTIIAREHEQYGTMLEVGFSLAQRWVELRGYNLRMRFQFLADGEAAAEVNPPDRPRATSALMQRFLDRAARERLQQSKGPSATQRQTD